MTSYDAPPGRNGSDAAENNHAEEQQLAWRPPAGIPFPPPPPPPPNQPLLPAPVARSITLSTGTIRGAMRTARTVGRVPFYAAMFTTTASIDLGRQVVDAFLGSSQGAAAPTGIASQTAGCSAGPPTATTATMAQRGFQYLQLLATAGFELAGGGAAALMDLSELILLLVDGTLGSTESSRALRSIFTFLSREFQNPATGRPGEKVGMRDLLWGLCALAYLQAACRQMDVEERAQRGVETVVWDVVVLDGRRVDVHESSLYGRHRGAYRRWGEAEGGEDGDDDNVNGDADGTEVDLPETRIQRQVAAAVAADARVVVTTSTAKIITVDITGSQPVPPIAPPPGVELVELGPLPPTPTGPSRLANTAFRIVFRANTSDTQTTTILPAEPGSDRVETETDSNVVSAAAACPPMADPVVNVVPAVVTPPKPAPAPAPAPVPQRASSMGHTAASEARANQKRVRKPQQLPGQTPPGPHRPPQRPPKTDALPSRLMPERKSSNGFRSVLKKPAIANLWHKEAASAGGRAMAERPGSPGPSSNGAAMRNSSGRILTVVQPGGVKRTRPDGESGRGGKGAEERPASPVVRTQRVLTPLTARALNRHEQPGGEASPTTYSFATYQRTQHSLMTDGLESLASSLADSVSIHTTATTAATAAAAVSAVSGAEADRGAATGTKNVALGHRRHRSCNNRSSIYTLHTNDSQASLVLSGYGGGARSQGTDLVGELRRTGRVAGLFPEAPLLDSLRRYMRFSSAAYGQDFLKMLGLYIPATAATATATAPGDAAPPPPAHHRDVAAYARHTGVRPEDLLLASFLDGAPATTTSTAPPRRRQTAYLPPLVHYVALDHAAGAVVLACRGTLGLEDVLADLACAYDDLVWRGRTYTVHQGVHAAARRLLYGGDGRVLATLRAALLRHPDYGLVLCGHSLGGAVTALLGVMLAEPVPVAGGGRLRFVTARGVGVGSGLSLGPPGPPGPSGSPGLSSSFSLPPGRPIHVFAYGPPGTMCESLRRATRGLITTVVQGDDVVPFLSLGVLHDLQAVALAFKTDDSRASAALCSHLWEALRTSLAVRWGGGLSGSGGSSSFASPAAPDDWDLAARKTLRASMLSVKLVPPGDVLAVEAQRVLQRMAYRRGDGSSSSSSSSSSSATLTVSPARRLILRSVRDVEARFHEVRLTLAALGDHSPGRYEAALEQLAGGVL